MFPTNHIVWYLKALLKKKYWCHPKNVLFQFWTGKIFLVVYNDHLCLLALKWIIFVAIYKYIYIYMKHETKSYCLILYKWTCILQYVITGYQDSCLADDLQITMTNTFWLIHREGMVRRTKKLESTSFSDSNQSSDYGDHTICKFSQCGAPSNHDNQYQSGNRTKVYLVIW